MRKPLKHSFRTLGEIDVKKGLPFSPLYDRWRKHEQLSYERGRFAAIKEQMKCQSVVNTAVPL